MAQKRKLPSVRKAVFNVELSTAEYQKVAGWLKGLKKDPFNVDDSAKAWREAVVVYMTERAEGEKAMQEILQRGYGLVAREIISLVKTDIDEAKLALHDMLQNFYGLLAKEVLGVVTTSLRTNLAVAKEDGMAPDCVASFQQWLDAADEEMKTTGLSMELAEWISELRKLKEILEGSDSVLKAMLEDFKEKMGAKKALKMLESSVPVTTEPDSDSPFAVLVGKVPDHVEAPVETVAETEAAPAPVASEASSKVDTKNVKTKKVKAQVTTSRKPVEPKVVPSTKGRGKGSAAAEVAEQLADEAALANEADEE